MAPSDRGLNGDPSAPSVAVCIPAYGDSAGLTRVLRSIEQVDYPRDRLRVIVAVDGPDARLEAAARDGGADDVVVSPTNRGSYAARNLALDALPPEATAVLFTDSDAEVDAQWVRRHLATLETSPRSGGAVLFELSDPPRPAEVVDARRSLNQEHYVLRLGYAATANLAVRREVVDQVRFDGDRRSGGDFEFGQRAGAAGFPIAYAADAVVRHPARPSARALLKKIDRVATGARALQSEGHEAAGRRVARRSIGEVARAHGFSPGPWWLVRAAAIDAACSIVFAARVPSVIGPALRRRVRRLGGRR